MDRATMAVVLDEIDDAIKRARDRLYRCQEEDEIYALTQLKERLEGLEDISIMEMAREEAVTTPDCFIKVNGVAQRCDCGCNVFRATYGSKPELAYYKCNSCGSIFCGDKE